MAKRVTSSVCPRTIDRIPSTVRAARPSLASPLPFLCKLWPGSVLDPEQTLYAVPRIDLGNLLIVFICSDVPSHRDRSSGRAFVALWNVIHTDFGKVKSDVFC